LRYSSFNGGRALYGGAIYWVSEGQAEMIVENSYFIDNASESSDDEMTKGGAIFVYT